MPDMIADAYHLVRQAGTEDQRREAFESQALVYRVTSGMLDRLGESHLPWVAAERSMNAAEQSGDPLVIAGGAWRLAVVLPEQLIFTRRVHSMLRGILRRERPSIRADMRALADFVGVAA